MRGNAQNEAARWVGRSSIPIFRRLWTKVHQIKDVCVCVYLTVAE